MMSDEKSIDKEKAREERLRRDAERFRENISIPRPGTKAPVDVPVLERHGIELSDVLYVPTSTLVANPLNDYPPLAAPEMAELVTDIKEKGILVPLISRPDGVIVCGHNRHRAALTAGLERVPVQRILSPLTDDLEREIMKSENDRRRGGNWSRAEKEKFIRENFGEAIAEDRRGGDHGNQYTGGKSSLNFRQSETLAKSIEKKSKGRIPEGTAKRLVAKIRKEAPVTATVPKLTEKERKRGEKLALQLKTIRQTRAMLEKKLATTKEEESRIVKELKTIGQPELFLKTLNAGADS
ncbi:ParB domain protein nuclease [Leptonema illini DSM 21528]|uniref:ParB domain protein nuclease n=2 Tax=Leptonema illini TaxID=183 RepID=H2CLL0_9LEPT|nr:ParB domain protein nuclease [Leptonema illini DSM 21528]